MFHAYEACDAVERMSYVVDGIAVSNFLTPSYFTVGDEAGTRNDFLGGGVTSFGVTSGSHIGFLDLATGKFEVVVGHREATNPAFQKRAALYDHAKPSRPERELQSILASYHANQDQAVRGVKNHPGLHGLKGISRQERYRAAAERASGKADLTACDVCSHQHAGYEAALI